MARNPNQENTFGGLDLVPAALSDTVPLAINARAIRCQATGTAGTVRFVSLSGALRNTSIAAGEVLNVGASQIHATGTTAIGLEIYI